MTITVLFLDSPQSQTTSDIEALQRENDVLKAENERLKIFLDRANLDLAKWERWGEEKRPKVFLKIRPERYLKIAWKDWCDWVDSRPSTYREILARDPSAPPGASSKQA